MQRGSVQKTEEMIKEMV